METMTKAARLEVKILETLQNKRTAVGDKNCIRMVTDFTYRGHTCLVFEPMVRLSALQAMHCVANAVPLVQVLLSALCSA